MPYNQDNQPLPPNELHDFKETQQDLFFIFNIFGHTKSIAYMELWKDTRKSITYMELWKNTRILKIL